MYQSRYAAFQILIQGREPVYSSDGNRVVDHTKELVAEFAMEEPEFVFHDGEDPERSRHANVRGYFFDLDEQAERKGWTQEEKDFVEQQVDLACKRFPGNVWLYSQPPAERPWPNYDEADPKMIAALAEQTGTAQAALVYEKENENREKVVEDLEYLLEKQKDEQELTAA